MDHKENEDIGGISRHDGFSPGDLRCARQHFVVPPAVKKTSCESGQYSTPAESSAGTEKKGRDADEESGVVRHGRVGFGYRGGILGRMESV